MKMTKQVQPYVLSIEETHGKSKQHGFHLSTDLKLAKQIAAEKFHARVKYNMPVVTVALMQNNKIVDCYDGKWASENYSVWED